MIIPKAYIVGIPFDSGGGFINYVSRTEESAAWIRKEVFKDFPNGVIINGSDNIYDAYYKRPPRIVRMLSVSILAYYHDGSSGFQCTGVVIDKALLPEFEVDYEETFGIPVNKWLTIYHNGRP